MVLPFNETSSAVLLHGAIYLLGFLVKFLSKRFQEFQTGGLKRRAFLKHLAIKIAKKLSLKTIKKCSQQLKNIRRFDVLGRHFQVKRPRTSKHRIFLNFFKVS